MPALEAIMAKPREAPATSNAVATPPALTPGRAPILVLPVDRLRSQARRLDGPAAVIVDATHRVPSLQTLVRILVLRRSLRACGGDVVLVAGSETVDVLRRSGLEHSIPCHFDVAAAARALS